MRIGEILGLAPENIRHPESARDPWKISIEQQRQDRGLVGPKTWRSVRIIEAPDLVAVELRRALRSNPPLGRPLLTGPREGTLNRSDWYRMAWRPALKGAGLDEYRYKFHSARHYAASAMLGRGVSVPEVAAYIGDSVPTLTAVYAHFLEDVPRAAKAALDAALAPPLPLAVEAEG